MSVTRNRAKEAISKAQWKKAADVCCILACVLWCPIENAITLGNGCGTGCDKDVFNAIGENCYIGCLCGCCVAMCCHTAISLCLHPTELGDSRIPWSGYSMWAPLTSIKHLRDDYAKNNEEINRLAPVAQMMI